MKQLLLRQYRPTSKKLLNYTTNLKQKEMPLTNSGIFE
jgi:hypothetical protein